MKIVINICFGGYCVKENIIEKYGISPDEKSRHDPRLIELIESGIDCNDEDSKLVVIDIPDESTDYIIEECDGVEHVLYVVDGKIHRLDPVWDPFFKVDPEWVGKCVNDFNARLISDNQL